MFLWPKQVEKSGALRWPLTLFQFVPELATHFHVNAELRYASLCLS